MTRAITLAASSAGSADASWRPAIVMGEERGKLETRYSPRTKLHAAAVALALTFVFLVSGNREPYFAMHACTTLLYGTVPSSTIEHAIFGVDQLRTVTHHSLA